MARNEFIESVVSRKQTLRVRRVSKVSRLVYAPRYTRRCSFGHCCCGYCEYTPEEREALLLKRLERF